MPLQIGSYTPPTLYREDYGNDCLERAVLITAIALSGLCVIATFTFPLSLLNYNEVLENPSRHVFRIITMAVSGTIMLIGFVVAMILRIPEPN